MPEEPTLDSLRKASPDWLRANSSVGIPESAEIIPAMSRWPDDERGPWVIAIDMRPVAGRFECVGIRIGPLLDEAPETLTSRAVRALPFSRLVQDQRIRHLAAAFAIVSDPSILNRSVEDAEERDLLVQYFQGLLASEQRHPGDVDMWRREARPRRGRTPKYDRDHYEAVADVYNAAWQRGESPRRAVADAFRVSKATAAKWVAKARRDGLLPPTERGKAQGTAGGAP